MSHSRAILAWVWTHHVCCHLSRQAVWYRFVSQVALPVWSRLCREAHHPILPSQVVTVTALATCKLILWPRSVKHSSVPMRRTENSCKAVCKIVIIICKKKCTFVGLHVRLRVDRCIAGTLRHVKLKIMCAFTRFMMALVRTMRHGMLLKASTGPNQREVINQNVSIKLAKSWHRKCCATVDRKESANGH